MIFTFYKARGLSVGKSLVEEDKLELAKELEAKAKAKGVQLLLPTDVVLADNFAPDANSQTADINAIPDGWMGLDIGPDSIKVFQDALADCQTVIWNGPMGVFEFEAFAKGTFDIADTLAELRRALTTMGFKVDIAAARDVLDRYERKGAKKGLTQPEFTTLVRDVVTHQEKETALKLATDDVATLTRENQAVSAELAALASEHAGQRGRLQEVTDRATRAEQHARMAALERDDVLKTYRAAVDETRRLEDLSLIHI